MSLKIVLIDDNDLFNFISAQTIKAIDPGCEVEEFTSASKALKYLKDAAGDPSGLPDIIFLDIKMQMMNGFEFLDEYNKLAPAVTHKTKVAMLSSTLLESDRKRALEYKNVIQFYDKPLTQGKLDQIKKMLLAN